MDDKARELQNTIKILKKALVTHQSRAQADREQFKTKSQEQDKKIKELADKLKEKERVIPSLQTSQTSHALYVFICTSIGKQHTER